jgi:hypothetical protein
MNPWITGIIAGINITGANQSKEAGPFLGKIWKNLMLPTLIILTISPRWSRELERFSVRKSYH